MPPHRRARSEVNEAAMPAVLPGGMPAGEFLADYWQRRPLLIPNAWPDFASPGDAADSLPISPDELAGLACEDDVEARLILERHGPTPWHVEHGPFAEDRFASLPQSHWTLLVQSVDHRIPGVAALREAFDFLPRWRLDDIMISYAAPQGSVGPHRDQYDVFLIQGMGRREWRLGAPVGAEDEYLTDSGLCLLHRFDETARYVLEAGDMLYLPPGVPHHGIALEAGMTLSVGFRAPAADECLAVAAELLPALARPLPRFGDAGRETAASPGAIDAADLTRLRETLRPLLDDDGLLAEVLGRLGTESPMLEVAGADPITFTGLLSNDRDTMLARHPAARLAWFEHAGGALRFFCNGESRHFAAPRGTRLRPLVQTLCERTRYRAAELAACLPEDPPAREAGRQLLDELLAQAVLLADEDGDDGP